MPTDIQKVGELSEKIILALNLNCEVGQPIMLSDSNILHMLDRHPAEYSRFGAFIPLIVKEPDYVGINPKDNSLEFVKEFQIEDEFVKVAIRASNSDTLFVRSLYCLNSNRVRNFVSKGTLKKFDIFQVCGIVYFCEGQRTERAAVAQRKLLGDAGMSPCLILKTGAINFAPVFLCVYRTVPCFFALPQLLT